MSIDRRSFIQAMAIGLAPGAVFNVPRAWATEASTMLTTAVGSEATSIDPHWHNSTPNMSVAQHIFDCLVHLDNKQRPIPGLAESWKTIDDLTWEFQLRENVKFHDGAPLEIDDLIFTYERAQNVPRAILSLRTYLADKTFEQVGERTLRVRTKKPNPITPVELATICVISRHKGENATTEDYNSGKAAIGTGPYKFKSFLSGQSINLERNDGYWGNHQDWSAVAIRPLPNGSARVAALKSRGVMAIDAIPPADAPGVESDANTKLVKGTTNRLVYLSFDQHREVSPYVKANDGSEIPNPFLKQAVREAVKLAIDRKAICERILSGFGVPAGQLVPEGIFGHNPDIKPANADPARAKELLAAAGYPDGFMVTLHGANDRHVRDTAVLQAIAQMLARVGIKVEVEAIPNNVFISRATTGGKNGEPEFSFFMISYGSSTGESSGAMRNVIHTFDKERGFGSNNRARFSIPELDALIEKAMTTLDNTERQQLYAECAAKAMDAMTIVPVYFPVSAWGLQKDIDFAGRSDERMMAMDISPSKQ